MYDTLEKRLTAAGQRTTKLQLAFDALEFANATGLDVAAAIETKMTANAKKYPVEKARGRSEKYTEL